MKFFSSLCVELSTRIKMHELQIHHSSLFKEVENNSNDFLPTFSIFSNFLKIMNFLFEY